MTPPPNAIILAAGTSSRFVPLSLEIPKGLLEVHGEILIERQIRQLKEAGIDNICVVVGYKAEKFQYLKDKFGVDLVINEDFARYNNISSLIRVIDRLGNTFICSCDNYFLENVFKQTEENAYYSALYAQGPTQEYCIRTDNDGTITGVSVGGADSWYMIGHVFFSNDFSQAFSKLLKQEYASEEIRHQYWEDVYINNIQVLPQLKIRKYEPHQIEEFDSLDELRKFDSSYLQDSRSSIIKDIARQLGCSEAELSGFRKSSGKSDVTEIYFIKSGEPYLMELSNHSIRKA